MEKRQIILQKVKVHNLKQVDLTLDHNQLIVFTGVSGSGKSSLAFDTIYVEGQRRYVESLSVHARRSLDSLPKPDAEWIGGLSPTIAIEQKMVGKNPRSTVGTITGIYDFLRVLFARIGIPHCPVSHEVVKPQSTEQILNQIKALPTGTRLILLSPFAKEKKGEFREEFADLIRKGITRIRLSGKLIDLSEEISIDGKVAHTVDIVIDRLNLVPEEEGRLVEGVAMALEMGGGVMSVLLPDEEPPREILFSQHAYSRGSGISYPLLSPTDFSFNHPNGMCPNCQGLGMTQEFDVKKVIDEELSIAQDCCAIASSYRTVRFKNIYDNLAKKHHFSVDTPWKNLSEEGKQVFLYGIKKKWVEMEFVHPITKSRWTEYVQWKGVLHEAKERYQKAESEVYRNKKKELLIEAECPSCRGERIRPYPAATTIAGKKIAEVTAMSIQEALQFFETIKNHSSMTEQEKLIGEEVVKEISQRLFFLLNVGLHYLTLDRTAPTLSGGESQRVRLASQIGSGLVGVTYVLDEPSIGLHPRDNTRLLEALRRLQGRGNTVIVVEHDEETIALADTVVDVGPLAGEKGGEILFQGKPSDLLRCEQSLTGAYLSGRKKIPIFRRKKGEGSLLIEGASHHNLKKIDVKIPLKVLTAVTGVSGSGKSSLIIDILYPALSNALHHSHLVVGTHKKITGIGEVDKVIAIDQTPIGRTPRSNPATFVKLFDLIRDLFSQLPQSQSQGYKAGRFSFNVREGSCPHCSGMGMMKIDMDFMEDEWITCKHCEGQRFDENTLSILYRGKNIYEILQMTVEEALQFFSSHSTILPKLQALSDVGLGYLRLGQPSPTLSGGEAQRIKLAKELSRPSKGKTFYILDEPTTGLHFYDIHKLVDVLHKLVSLGNTVLVIEHNMDLVKTADWVIDLGPEGGKGGGEIIGTGTPEAVAKQNTPTGIAIQKSLMEHPLIGPTDTSPPLSPLEAIVVKGASQNNLQQVDGIIPRGKITVCTGPSGSGKSSFAFETVYAEGQRRYIESLSPYSRQFVKQMEKAKVEQIEGLSPSIAIEQKSHAGNPRSTIGTMTEIYDYLRVLYAYLGTPYCPETQEEIRTISKEDVLNQLLDLPEGTKIQILSPVEYKRRESFETLKEKLQTLGFLRIRLNGVYYELDEEIPFDDFRKNALFLVIDRVIISQANRGRILSAIHEAAHFSNNTFLAALEEKDLFFNLSFAVPSTGKSYPPITPHSFSFNTEQGMCLDCQGLGFQYGADLSFRPELLKKSSEELFFLLWKENGSRHTLSLMKQFFRKFGIDPKAPLKTLTEEQLHILFHGSSEKIEKEDYFLSWRGINSTFALLAKSVDPLLKELLIPFLNQTTCSSCQGTRINPLARHVKINHLSIADFCHLPIDEAVIHLNQFENKKGIANLEETLSQLKSRLHFLQTIGLGYLSLDRSAPTLSGGETQRIRLARQLGSGLSGCLYVLDEPTIGLHPHDNHQLNQALRHLCSLGNTLLLVEHDPMTIQIADWILDFGPHAGKQGGKITAAGTIEDLLKNPHSLTGAYLSGRKKVPPVQSGKQSTKSIQLRNVSCHNINHLNLDIPIGVMTCLTGVSGSGKSTLLNQILRPAVEEFLQHKKWRKKRAIPQSRGVLALEHFEKLQVLDQKPIGHTSRADVSTYVDLLTPLRGFFAELPEAKQRGLQPRHFSFNYPKGMCTACQGLGTKTISLQFLPPVKVVCDSCRGFRLNPLSLQVEIKGKHLGHLLQMTVKEALAFLPPIPKVVRILETLISVGLDYLQLGQEIATLSGGEGQRIRLSKELSSRQTGKTLYLFDEPTTGLHVDDIVKLLQIFEKLKLQGNTILIIEHNLDVIASADHIIDIGPGSGAKGGQVVATGTPEEIACHPQALIAPYLKEKILL